MWEIKLVIAISRLNSTWSNLYTSLEMIINMCNMRGDDIYNVNQFVINNILEYDKFAAKDRRRLFIARSQIIDEEVHISDIILEEKLVIKIIKNKQKIRQNGKEKRINISDQKPIQGAQYRT